MLLQGLQGAASGKAQLDGNRSAAPRLRDARQLAQLFGAGELAAGKDFLDKATNAPGVHSPEMGCAPRELKACATKAAHNSPRRRVAQHIPGAFTNFFRLVLVGHHVRVRHERLRWALRSPLRHKVERV